MSDLNDDQNDDLEDDLNEETEDESTESDDSGESEEKPPKDDPKGVEKRIRDLQSKADAAEARANKAEAALKRGAGSAAGTNDPAVKAVLADLREASLDAVFGEFPELKEYSIDRSLIEGSSRTEIRENASLLVGLIKSVSTKARNKALADAGIEAPQSGASRSKPVDYAAMSDEDFKKMLDERRRG